VSGGKYFSKTFLLEIDLTLLELNKRRRRGCLQIDGDDAHRLEIDQAVGIRPQIDHMKLNEHTWR
jgi:hypothetical protein